MSNQLTVDFNVNVEAAAADIMRLVTPLSAIEEASKLVTTGLSAVGSALDSLAANTNLSNWATDACNAYLKLVDTLTNLPSQIAGTVDKLTKLSDQWDDFITFFRVLKLEGVSTFGAIKGAAAAMPTSIKIAVALVGAQMAGQALAWLFDQVGAAHDRAMAKMMETMDEEQKAFKDLTFLRKAMRDANDQEGLKYLEYVKQRKQAMRDLGNESGQVAIYWANLLKDRIQHYRNLESIENERLRKLALQNKEVESLSKRYKIFIEDSETLEIKEKALLQIWTDSKGELTANSNSLQTFQKDLVDLERQLGDKLDPKLKAVLANLRFTNQEFEKNKKVQDYALSIGFLSKEKVAEEMDLLAEALERNAEQYKNNPKLINGYLQLIEKLGNDAQQTGQQTSAALLLQKEKLLDTAKATNTLTGEQLIAKQKSDELKKAWGVLTDEGLIELNNQTKYLVASAKSVKTEYGTHPDIMNRVTQSVLDQINAYVGFKTEVPDYLANFGGELGLVQTLMGEWVKKSDAITFSLMGVDFYLPKVTDKTKKNADATKTASEKTKTWDDNFKDVCTSISTSNKLLQAFKTGATGMGAEFDDTANALFNLGNAAAGIADGIKSKDPAKVIGGVFQAFQALFSLFEKKKDWKKEAREALQGLAGVTKDMQDKLAKTAEELGSTEKALARLMDDFIKAANMRDAADFSSWSGKVEEEMNKALAILNTVEKNDAMTDMEKYAAMFMGSYINSTYLESMMPEYLTNIGSAFSELAKRADEFKMHGSETMLTLIQGAKRLRDANWKIPEVLEYINTQLNNGITAFGSYVKGAGDAATAVTTARTNLEGMDVGSDEYTKAKDELVALEATFNEMSSQETFDRSVQYAAGFMNSLQQEGKTMIEIVDLMGSQLDQLINIQDAGGYQNGALSELLGLREFVVDNKEVMESIGASTQMLEAFGNSGYLTADLLKTSQQDVMAYYNTLTAGNQNQKEALQALAPLLAKQLWYADQNNIELDEGTKLLIGQAQQQGINFETMIPPTERIVALLEELRDYFTGGAEAAGTYAQSTTESVSAIDNAVGSLGTNLSGVANHFGVTLPAGFSNLSQAAAGSFSGIGTGLSGLSTALSGAGTQLTENLPAGFSQLQTSGTENIAAVTAAVGEWTTNLSGVAGQLATDIPEGLAQMQVAAEGSFAGVNENVGAISTTFGQLSEQAQTQFPESLTTMQELAAESFAGLRENTGMVETGLAELIAKTQEEAPAAWEMFRESGQTNFDALTENGQGLTDKLEEIKIKASDEMSVAFEHFKESGQVNFDALGQQSQGLQDQLDIVKTKAQDEVTVAWEKLKESGGLNFDILTQNAGGLTNELEVLKTKARDEVTAAWDTLKNSGNNNFDALKDGGDKLNGKLDELKHKAQEELTAAMAKMKEKGITDFGELEDKGQLWSNQFDELKGKADVKMVEALKTMEQKGTATFGELQGKAGLFGHQVDDTKGQLEVKMVSALKTVAGQAQDSFGEAGNKADVWVGSLKSVDGFITGDMVSGLNTLKQTAISNFTAIDGETGAWGDSLSGIERQIRNNLTGAIKDFDDEYTDRMSGHSIITETNKWNDSLLYAETVMTKQLPVAVRKLDAEYRKAAGAARDEVDKGTDAWGDHFSVLDRIDYFQQKYDDVNESIKKTQLQIDTNTKALDNENISQEEKNDLKKIGNKLEEELQALLEERGTIAQRSEPLITVTQEMQEKIEELAETMGDLHAAASTMMADIIKEADINAGNFDDYVLRTREIIADLARGTLTIEETEKAMGDSFSELLKNAQELGTEGSRQMVGLLQDVRAAGLEVAEIQDYVNGKLNTAVSALSDYIGTFADTAPIKEDITGINEKLAENETALDKVNQELMTRGLSQQRINELEEQAKTLSDERFGLIDELMAKEGEYKDAQTEIGENWEFMQAMALSTFSALESEGHSFIEIVGMMQGDLTNLAGMAVENGLTITEGLKNMTDTAAFIDQNQELCTRIESTRTMMEALGDSAYLTNNDFTMFAEQTVAQFQAIEGETNNSELALRLMAPALGDLKKYSESYGFAIDANTQSLIDQATEQGLLADQQKTDAEVTNGLLLAIAQTIGATIPAELATLAGAVDTKTGEITAKTGEWDSSLGDVQKKIATDIPGAVDALDKKYKDKMTGHSIVPQTNLWKTSLDTVKRMMRVDLPQAITDLDKKYTDKMTGHSIVTETNKWNHSLQEVNEVLGRELLDTADSLDKKYAHVMENVYVYLKKTSKEGFMVRMSFDQMVDEMDRLQDSYDQLARKKERTDEEDNLMADYKRQIKELGEAIEETAPTLENFQEHFKTFQDQLSRDIGVNKGMIEIARSVREQGQSFKEIDTIIEKSLTSGSKGMADWIDALGTSEKELDALNKLQEERTKLEAKEKKTAEDLIRLDELDVEIERDRQRIQASMVNDQDAILNSQQMMVAYFHSLKAEGKSVSEIMTIMGDSFDALAGKDLTGLFGDSGFELSKPFVEMYQMQQKMSDNQSLVKGIEGLSTALHGMGDSMLYMSDDTFGTFEEASLGAFKKLREAGFDEMQQLQLMAPVLRDLGQYADEYGFTLSDSSAKLLEDAKKNNMIKEKEKSDTEKLIEVNERLADVMKEVSATLAGISEINPFNTVSAGTIHLKQQIQALKDELVELEQDKQTISRKEEHDLANIDNLIAGRKEMVAQAEKNLEIGQQKADNIDKKYADAIETQTKYIQELEQKSESGGKAADANVKELARQITVKERQKKLVEQELERVAGKSPVMEKRALEKLENVNVELDRLDKRYNEAREIAALAKEESQVELAAAMDELKKLEEIRAIEQEKAGQEKRQLERELTNLNSEILKLQEQRAHIQARAEKDILQLQAQVTEVNAQMNQLIDQLRFGPVPELSMGYQSAAQGYHGLLDRDTVFQLHRGEQVDVWTPEETERIRAGAIQRKNLSDTEPRRRSGDIVFEHVTVQSENKEETVKEFMTAIKGNKYGVQYLIRKIAH